MRKFIFIVPFLLLLCSTPVYAAENEDTYISEEIQQICIEYGDQYDICPELLIAIIERESSGDANAVNGSCKGLMQISEKWHQDRMERLGVSNIFDIHGNILVGCDYLSELFDEYEDVGVVLMVYHGEKNATTKMELSDYASGILERSAELERLHEEKERGDRNEESLYMQSIPSYNQFRAGAQYQLCEKINSESFTRWFRGYYATLISYTMPK